MSGEVQLASDERRSVDSGVVGIAKPSERQRASSGIVPTRVSIITNFQ